MNLSEVKDTLPKLPSINFRLPNGDYVAPHFHVTEVGLVTKHFIDCGGMERKETLANFQLLEAADYDHRLAPQKFLNILDLSKKVLGEEDYEVEVEYQGSTIGKFGLDFDGKDFILASKSTKCLAEDACGIADKTPKNDNCCGGPPVNDESACCVKDEDAKLAGHSGCGCAASSACS